MTEFSNKKQMANDRWVVQLIEDGEDLILPFNNEMIETTGWQVGDTLLWEKAAGSAWILRKKP
jgi:hypothetical protein